MYQLCLNRHLTNGHLTFNFKYQLYLNLLKSPTKVNEVEI